MTVSDKPNNFLNLVLINFITSNQSVVKLFKSSWCFPCKLFEFTMSSSLPFEKVKKIKTCKWLYSYECQSLFDCLNNPYYQIPIAINYIILLFYHLIIESSILLIKNDILLDLFDKNNKFNDLDHHFNYNPIFKGTIDGFSEDSFVSKCHNKENLLIIIETSCNCVYGAYTSIGWKGKNTGYLSKRKDIKAFIFFVRNSNHLDPIIIDAKTTETTHIASYIGYYCYFGDTLWLNSYCNINSDNCILSNVYGPYGKTIPGEYAKLQSYSVNEIEVFQLK